MYHAHISVCWVNYEGLGLTIDYSYYYLSILGKNLLVPLGFEAGVLAILFFLFSRRRKRLPYSSSS
jgi:hypothetical protein